MKPLETKGATMIFPHYVPEVVRNKIRIMLDGDDWEPMGWHSALKSAEERLTKIKSDLMAENLKGETLDGLRRKLIEEKDHRDMLAGDVSCLHRLATDPRMEEVYERLSEEFVDDAHWRGFIHSAWAAEVNFSKYREQLKRTADLNNEIVKTAQKLSDLLKKTADTGFSNWPQELYSIPELLRKTDNHEMQDRNLHIWRIMREHILGDRPKPDLSESGSLQDESKQTFDSPIVIRFVSPEKADIDPEEGRRNILRYAWGTAPDLSALLDTVAMVSREFKPTEYGMIGAALKSRQRSRAGNKEYLRAFGNLLTEVYDIPLTINVRKAMAQAATVVLNHPRVVVGYDDVVKAIK